MRKFLLGRNAVKNSVSIEKCFKQKLREIKFPPKTQWTHISIYPKNGARGSKDLFFKYNAQKWEENFYINLETSSSNSVK